MSLPSREDAAALLDRHVQDAYQRHHARSVVELGLRHLGLDLDPHIASVARFLAPLG